MKNQALFSSKDRSKKLKCHLLQFLYGTLRVKKKNKEHSKTIRGGGGRGGGRGGGVRIMWISLLMLDCYLIKSPEHSTFFLH